MIVFSAFLVAVAVGLLAAGVVTSKLLLVYAAIGVSGVSLLALGLGALIKRNELFGAKPEAASVPVPPPPVPVHAPSAPAEPQGFPQPVAAAAEYGWSVAAQPGPPRAGYLPSDQPPRIHPPAAPPPPPPPPAFTPTPFAPAEPVAASTPLAPTVTDDQPAATPSPPVPDDQPISWSGGPGYEAPGGTAPADQAQATVEPEPEPITPAPDEQAPASAASEPQPPETPPPADTDAPPANGAAPLDVDLHRQVTVVPGVPRYHNANCILIRFMGEDDLSKMSLGEARQAGCTPCRACQPDQPEASRA